MSWAPCGGVQLIYCILKYIRFILALPKENKKFLQRRHLAGSKRRSVCHVSEKGENHHIPQQKGVRRWNLSPATTANGASLTHFVNDLVVAKPDGAPFRRDAVSTAFGQLIRHLEMPHLRFHDLRHTAATNMHQLTGDFYTVGEILGHTLKGIGMSLGISTNFDAVTAQYVDVRLDRKKAVLETYHKALHPQKEAAAATTTASATKKPGKKKSSEMEL